MEHSQQLTIPVLSNEGSRYRFQKGHRPQRKQVKCANISQVLVTPEVVPIPELTEDTEVCNMKDSSNPQSWIGDLDEVSDDSFVDEKQSNHSWDDVSDSPLIDSGDEKDYHIIDQDRDSSHDEKDDGHDATEHLHEIEFDVAYRSSKPRYFPYKTNFFRSKIYLFSKAMVAKCVYQTTESDEETKEVTNSSMGFAGNKNPFVMIKKEATHGNKELHQGKADIQQIIDGADYPLLGLGYIVEIWDKSNTTVRNYRCILCKETLKKSTVKKHVAERSHRVSFIKKHFPDCAAEFPDFEPHLWNMDSQAILDKISKEIEKTFGRQLIFITNHEYYIKNVKKILDAISSFQDGLHEKDHSLFSASLKSLEEHTCKVEVSDVPFVIKQEKVDPDRDSMVCSSPGDSPDIGNKESNRSQHSLSVDTEENIIKPNYYQGDAKIQDQLDSIKTSLLGLGYVLEIWDDKMSEVRNYRCFLCNESFLEITIINHINRVAHKKKYLDKHCPNQPQQFPNKPAHAWRKARKDAFEKLCKEVEIKRGRKQLFITTQSNFLRHFKTIERALMCSEDLHDNQGKGSQGSIGNTKGTCETPCKPSPSPSVSKSLTSSSMSDHSTGNFENLQKGISVDTQINIPKVSSPLSSSKEIPHVNSNVEISPFKKTPPLSGIREVSPLSGIKETPPLSGFMEEAPLRDVKEEPLCDVKKEPLCDVMEAPLSDVKEAPLSDAKEAPLSDAKEAPLSDAKEAPLSDDKEAPLSDAKETPLSDAKEASLSDAKEASLSDVKEAPLSDVKEALYLSGIKERPSSSDTKDRPLNIGKGAPSSKGSKGKPILSYQKKSLRRLPSNSIKERIYFPSNRVRVLSSGRILSSGVRLGCRAKVSSSSKNVEEKKHTSMSALGSDGSKTCGFNHAEHSSQWKKLSPSVEVSERRKLESPTLHAGNTESYKAKIDYQRTRSPTIAAKSAEDGSRLTSRASGTAKTESRRNLVEVISLSSRLPKGLHKKERESFDSPSHENISHKEFLEKSTLGTNYSDYHNRNLLKRRRPLTLRSRNYTVSTLTRTRSPVSPRERKRSISPRDNIRTRSRSPFSPIYRAERRRSRDRSLKRFHNRERFSRIEGKSHKVYSRSKSSSRSRSISISRRDKYRLSRSRSPSSTFYNRKSRMEDAIQRRNKKSSGNLRLKKRISRSPSFNSRSPSYVSRSPSRRKRESRRRRRSSSSDSSWLSPKRRYLQTRESPLSRDRDSSRSRSWNRSSSSDRREDSFKHLKQQFRSTKLGEKASKIKDFLETIQNAKKCKTAKENNIFRSSYEQENYSIAFSPSDNTDNTDRHLYGDSPIFLPGDILSKNPVSLPTRSQDIGKSPKLTEVCDKQIPIPTGYFGKGFSSYPGHPSTPQQNFHDFKERQTPCEPQYFDEIGALSHGNLPMVESPKDMALYLDGAVTPQMGTTSGLFPVNQNKNRGASFAMTSRPNDYAAVYNEKIPDVVHSHKPRVTDTTLFQKMRQTVNKLFGTASTDDPVVSGHTSESDLGNFGIAPKISAGTSYNTDFNLSAQSEFRGNDFTSPNSWKANSGAVNFVNPVDRKPVNVVSNVGSSQQSYREPVCSEISGKPLRTGRSYYHLAQDPENYEKEWKKFYKQRASDLLKEGKDPSGYDFNKDWVSYLKNFNAPEPKNLPDFQTNEETYSGGSSSVRPFDDPNHVVGFQNSRSIPTNSHAQNTLRSTDSKAYQKIPPSFSESLSTVLRSEISGPIVHAPFERNVHTFNQPKLPVHMEPKAVVERNTFSIRQQQTSYSLQSQFVDHTSLGGHNPNSTMKTSASTMFTTDSLEPSLMSRSGSTQEVDMCRVQLAYRLSNVLTNLGMTDISGSLLSEMLTKIGAYSESPSDVSETQILSLLRGCGYAI